MSECDKDTKPVKDKGTEEIIMHTVVCVCVCVDCTQGDCRPLRLCDEI